MRIFILSFLLLSTSACDSTVAKLEAFGGSAHVTCYSGTEVIYEGFSSGKVLSEEGSDGYFFRDSKTGRAMEVSGNCVIDYGAPDK